VKRFLVLFFAQLGFYGLVALDIRAVATRNLPAVAILNIVIATLSYTVIRKVADAKGMWEFLAFVTGGTIGAVGALWILPL
jgi:hypothetical protein